MVQKFFAGLFLTYMQEKSAIWATLRPLLIGLYAKNRRGGHIIGLIGQIVTAEQILPPVTTGTLGTPRPTSPWRCKVPKVVFTSS